MKINFNSIKFKNIFSYGNKITEFHFENGIDLVTGKNGNGKSTFVDALTFALFGKPFRKIKLGNLINNKNNKDLWVEVVFDVNGRLFKVIRGQKPQIFDIFKMSGDEWEKVESHSTVKDHQKYLEEHILQFGESVYRQLIALGANLSSSRSFMDLTKSEKEEVLQVITDTAIFNSIKEKTKERKLRLKTLETDFSYQSKVLNQSLSSARVNITQMEKQNSEFKNNKESVISSILAEIETKEKKIPQYQSALEKLTEVKIQHTRLQRKLEPMEEASHELEKQRDDIEADIRAFVKNENEKIVCPKCSFEMKQDLGFSADELRESLKQTKTRIADVGGTIAPLRSEIEEMRIQLTNEKRIELNFQALQKEISELRERLESTYAWDEIAIDYTEIEKIESDYRRANNKLISTRKDITDLCDIESMVSDKNLKGIILNQQLPFLNRFINEFLELFESKFNFVIDEEFKETIISRGSDNEFNSLSNGQKQRITMSILFAFLKLIEERNGVSTNLLILDEYLDSSLDIDGINEVLRILDEVFSETKDVVLISHNPDIKNRFELINRSFKTSLEDGFSSFDIENM